MGGGKSLPPISNRSDKDVLVCTKIYPQPGSATAFIDVLS